jgi:hypothetical protein
LIYALFANRPGARGGPLQAFVPNLVWDLMANTDSLAASKKNKGYDVLIPEFLKGVMRTDATIRNLIGCLFGRTDEEMGPELSAFKSEVLRTFRHHVSLGRRKAMNRFKASVTSLTEHVRAARAVDHIEEPIARYHTRVYAYDCVPRHQRSRVAPTGPASIKPKLVLLVEDIINHLEHGPAVIDEDVANASDDGEAAEVRNVRADDADADADADSDADDFAAPPPALTPSRNAATSRAQTPRRHTPSPQASMGVSVAAPPTPMRRTSAISPTQLRTAAETVLEPSPLLSRGTSASRDNSQGHRGGAARSATKRASAVANKSTGQSASVTGTGSQSSQGASNTNKQKRLLAPPAHDKRRTTTPSHLRDFDTAVNADAYASTSTAQHRAPRLTLHQDTEDTTLTDEGDEAQEEMPPHSPEMPLHDASVVEQFAQTDGYSD